MKNFQAIKKHLIQTYETHGRRVLIQSKFSGPMYDNWKRDFGELNIGDLTFRDDTTGENMCFTTMAYVGQIKQEAVYLNYYFYLHKSILGDFATCYSIIRSQVQFPEGNIPLPRVVISSHIGPFADLFKPLWQKVKTVYPDCIYLNYDYLKMKIHEIDLADNEVYDLLFGYEGKLSHHHGGDAFFSPDRQ